MSVPTFYGEPARRALVAQWGLPSSAPTPRQVAELGLLAYLAGRCRLLFVDDFADGTPVAYWEWGGCQ